MTGPAALSAALSGDQLARVRAAAAVLLPGAPDCPGPGELPDYEDLVQTAARALSSESSAVADAIGRLPADLSWDSVTAYADQDPESFELLSLVVLGAYFMSATVRTALGLPTGGVRRPAPRDQVVDELGTGLLDAVLERGNPTRTQGEISAAEAAT